MLLFKGNGASLLPENTSRTIVGRAAAKRMVLSRVLSTMHAHDPFEHFGHCRRHNSTPTLVDHVLMLGLRMLCDGLIRFVVRRSADLQSCVQSPLRELHDWLPSSRACPCTKIE